MSVVEELLKPIPGANPCGQSLRYAPISEQIKEARRQDDDLDQGIWKRERKKADYALVVKLSGQALSSQSKDLQIAAWLTEALLCREGLPGLHQGLELMRGLLETYWDHLYPEIDEDGDLELRATPLGWVATQLDRAVRNITLNKAGHTWFDYRASRTIPTEDEAAADEAKLALRHEAIEEEKVTPEDFEEAFDHTPKAFYQKLDEDLKAVLSLLESFGVFCDEKFGEVAPNFGPLRDSLQEVGQAIRILLVKKREKEPDPLPAGEEAAGQPAWAQAAPSADFSTAAAAGPAAYPGGISAEPADREDAIRRVVSAAGFLRRLDPSSPASYLMLRGLRWGELRSAGDPPDPGFLEPPPTAARVDLRRLVHQEQWMEALEAAENAMGLACGRAWLDLQRYAVRACRVIGYESAANAIRSELRALLGDLPRLPEWTLADDTPTANPETREWLKQEGVLPGASAGFSLHPATEATPADGAAAPPEAYELALEAARSGRIEEALAILLREASQERTGRARFLRKVQLVQICMATGHEAVGFPILQELAAEIERLHLDEWESPDMVAQPLAMLFRCLDRLSGSEEEKQRIYAWICRLDPVQALNLPK